MKRLCVVVSLGLAIGAGCSRTPQRTVITIPGASSGGTGTSSTASRGVASVPSTTQVTPARPALPETLRVAAEIIAQVQKKQLRADRLTPAFKKLIAPPRTEAEQALGYSDWAAEAWLEEHTAGLSGDQLQGLTLDANTTIVTTKPLASPGGNFVGGRALIRLVQVQNQTLVDWITVANLVNEFDFQSAPAPAFTAAAFLDAVLSRQPRLAQGLIAPTAARAIAPPLDRLDEQRGFSEGILTIKLNNFRGDAQRTEQLKLQPLAGGYELSGQFIGRETRPFKVRVVADAGRWLVQEFQPN